MNLRHIQLVGASFAIAASAAIAAPGDATNAEIGKAAPAFTLTDLDGKKVSLADFKGKVVVLEWFNPDCPISRGAHVTGLLKNYPGQALKEGVVWLAINSGAKAGSGVEKNSAAKKEFAMPYPVLLDEDGTVGHAYGAKTTPHMFVIDKTGVLTYEGAIDNAPQGKPEEGERVNYVEEALGSLAKGEKVATSHTTPYGCSVKFAGGGSPAKKP